MTAALHFQDVTLRLGARTILQNLDIAIPQGAVVGLLGPNGAGKTTLLRAALGLVPPAAGHIHVLGAPAQPGRTHAGYMPQGSTALAELRLAGRDFVAAASLATGWGLPRPDHADIDRVLALTDATAFAHRPVATLSGGERQRLMLAQALLGRPKLLLLDEPLAGLDPRHQAATVALIRTLADRLGIAVLVSAHDVNILRPALDLVLYLAAGRAVIGPVSEVVTAPVLSGLYGAPVHVFETAGHVFVVTDAGI